MALTPKQQGFADDYLETGNGTQSALNNYDTEDPNTAGAIAHENLRKPKIRQYLENEAEGAVGRIAELSKTAENEAVKLNANKDILDRAGYKPTEKTDITTGGEKINSEELKKLSNKFDDFLSKHS